MRTSRISALRFRQRLRFRNVLSETPSVRIGCLTAKWHLFLRGRATGVGSTSSMSASVPEYTEWGKVSTAGSLGVSVLPRVGEDCASGFLTISKSLYLYAYATWLETTSRICRVISPLVVCGMSELGACVGLEPPRVGRILRDKFHSMC